VGGGVESEDVETACLVVVGGGVASEDVETACLVVVGGGVESEDVETACLVAVGGGVASEDVETACLVAVGRGVASEDVETAPVLSAPPLLRVTPPECASPSPPCAAPPSIAKRQPTTELAGYAGAGSIAAQPSSSASSCGSPDPSSRQVPSSGTQPVGARSSSAPKSTRRSSTIM